MDTLLLDTDTWDLTRDIDGNIAVATKPYALAQDAASAAKTFAEECYWDTTIGVPYRTQILGLNPPLGLVKALLTAQVKRIPDVINPKVFLTTFTDRSLAGQIQVTDEETGEPAAINFTVISPQGVG